MNKFNVKNKLDKKKMFLKEVFPLNRHVYFDRGNIMLFKGLMI